MESETAMAPRRLSRQAAVYVMAINQRSSGPSRLALGDIGSVHHAEDSKIFVSHVLPDHISKPFPMISTQTRKRTQDHALFIKDPTRVLS